MAEIKYKITDHIATLSTTEHGWTVELNLISWNDHQPKLDIRSWSPNHERMGKGVTLTNEEGQKLAISLQEYLKTTE